MIWHMPSPAAPRLNRLPVALKALLQLGARPLGLYALYQLGLRSGHYRRLTGPRLLRQLQHDLQSHPDIHISTSLFQLPTQQALSAVLGESGRLSLLAEADEIVQGSVRLFGAPPVPLQLVPPPPLSHWTSYARQHEASQDIKFTWEPARFSWAVVLARAYHLTSDQRYAASFWQYTEHFLSANPPFEGPNWVSAQEVALRLISLIFAYQVFSLSPHTTVAHSRLLLEAVAVHAARIPLTWPYAHAQDNNHLLSEAAGLLTASLALPHHPHASRWSRLGWSWFTRAIRSQFDRDGAYTQHSANYHRLALQLCLWLDRLLPHSFPPPLLHRLSSASRWLLNLHDPHSGRLPNLGPNDGALLLPLSTTPFDDFRPVLQSASAAFLDRLPFPPGPWDESRLWLGLPQHVGQAFSLSTSSADPVQAGKPAPDAGPASDAGRGRGLESASSLPPTPHLLRSPDGLSWAYLRLAHFTSRPGHADQLHLDLWSCGLNLALDAGTYLYNAPPPWDNPLAGTAVHNTLTVDGLDQMTPAGRFLFLDWAQARLLSYDDRSLTAEHDGYRRLGLLHRRTLSISENNVWRIDDSLLPLAGPPPSPHTACLHWLLPDWGYSLVSDQVPENESGSFSLLLESPHGQVGIRLSGGSSQLQLTRAGELLYGAGPLKPTWGWSSPTYGVKIPALSLRLSQIGLPSMTFTTLFTLPH